MVQDAHAREQATDPEGSYIVQAPAGSGKTELLTQRYLRLLARVKAPEEIIALTFTRKAAHEMRARILKALGDAAAQKEAASAHQKQTQNYAHDALARDKEYQWQLLKSPHRLRVMTIDALCQSLEHAMPLKDNQNPFSTISAQPKILYREAAQLFLKEALNNNELEEPISQLLDHLDNQQEKLLHFMEDLLHNREQWMRPLLTLHATTRKDFEKALSTIESHEMERFTKAIPETLKSALQILSQQLASIENDEASLRFPLKSWTNPKVVTKPIIQALAALLFTKNNELRKSFDHHVGLRRDNCDKKIYDTLKKASQDLLKELQHYPDFIRLLVHLKNLPEAKYNEQQWVILQALLVLLPYLLAFLQLVFHDKNATDFSAVLQQALTALGATDAPTDLALYLDYSIHHLLIDEFQDTSISQFQLLEKLISGWEQDAGKTLFIVGDPMQSIYRFRQAEVGLFLKARQQGIADIRLKALELSSNFRSTKKLVLWVNHQFTSIFPLHEDMETGAISFHQATNVLEDTDDSKIEAYALDTQDGEALKILNIIKQELSLHPKEEIAILVRNRSQLKTIISLLKTHDIPFQGVEIEQLAHMPHLQDMWTLTKALLLPANRLYWLAFLRSPWAGLSLSDLLVLSHWNKKRSILEALEHMDALSLSEEGLTRARFIYHNLTEALEKRHQKPLIDWLIETTQNLYADKIRSQDEQNDLEQFWSLLEQFLSQEGFPNIKAFEQELGRLYSKTSMTSKLQIMTIHKSKGLEFDTVILPSLGSLAQKRSTPLIRWLTLPKRQNEPLVLVSPIHAAHQERCPLYDYLGSLDAEKERYEIQRLFYVAVTRAKKRLYLTDSHEKGKEGSFRSLLKEDIFNTFTEAKEPQEPTDLIALKRLPLSYYQQKPKYKTLAKNQPLTMPIPTIKRQFGIIAHSLLQWICTYHPADLEALPWMQIRQQMQQQGFSLEEEEQSMVLLRQYIEPFWNTERGRWIAKAHESEENEYALLVTEEGVTRTQIMDRTFCENGLRWIIDFKTGKEDKISEEQHRQQLNSYAALFQKLSPAPIHCGIYYLASQSFVTWAYEDYKAAVSGAE